LSSDPNRPRPRSSKKRRAVQSGGSGGGSAGSERGGPPGGTGRSNRPARPGVERAGGGAVRGGSSSGGIPTAWLAVIAVVLFAVGVALAGGAINFGGGGSAPSSPIDGGASAEASASAAARGTNCPTAQPPAAPAGQARVVTIETAKGKIEITLRSDLSPIAVGNFAALAACGFYDGVVFHRAATLQDGTPFVIQGGDPTGTGSGGPGYEIQDEPVTTAYVRGTVAMARTSAPNSVGSQFFIVLDDKDQSVLAAANTYQIIGSVTAGMETVDAIYAAAGGQELPASPIAMDKVTIGDPVAPTPSVAPSVGPSAAPSAAASASPS
jgi:peptidyl-prolyl cis-trans isomerase B (cyclophilin B)